MTIKFEVGKSYATRSMVDYDSWFRVTIVGRTKCTVKLRREGRENIQTCQPRPNNGIETIKPWGNYSMCPVIWATNEDPSAKSAVTSDSFPPSQPAPSKRD
jgi:hypothetical protein